MRTSCHWRAKSSPGGFLPWQTVPTEPRIFPPLHCWPRETIRTCSSATRRPPREQQWHCYRQPWRAAELKLPSPGPCANLSPLRLHAGQCPRPSHLLYPAFLREGRLHLRRKRIRTQQPSKLCLLCTCMHPWLTPQLKCRGRRNENVLRFTLRGYINRNHYLQDSQLQLRQNVHVNTKAMDSLKFDICSLELGDCFQARETVHFANNYLKHQHAL